jgi:integrase
VLADRELAIVWHALPDSDYGEIVKLLILTGQRREEIGALRRSEVDLEELVIALPPERTKNGRPHEVPLSKPALAILKSRPSRAGRDFMFGDGPRNGNHRQGGFQGWSKSKSALDKQMAIGSWRLHDVRRTVATRMPLFVRSRGHLGMSALCQKRTFALQQIASAIRSPRRRWKAASVEPRRL